MIKSAQNVIGSVMCCPGCFSLYRASAVRDVMANYAGPTQSPFDVFIKDTGKHISCSVSTYIEEKRTYEEVSHFDCSYDFQCRLMD